MEDSTKKEERSFISIEREQEGNLDVSRPVETEFDFHHEEDKHKEMSPRLQLNIEKTKEEFEILYTRI